MIQSVEIYDSNIRWRCFHFLNPVISRSKETFGSKTSKPALFVAELKEFQTEMHDIVKTVKFRKPKYNSLQTKLKEDIRKLRNDEKVYVAADKTSNSYKLTQEK